MNCYISLQRIVHLSLRIHIKAVFPKKTWVFCLITIPQQWCPSGMDELSRQRQEDCCEFQASLGYSSKEK